MNAPWRGLSYDPAVFRYKAIQVAVPTGEVVSRVNVLSG